MKAQLSIIIPTHERPDILQQCLYCVERQTVLKEKGENRLEVIVVSDGPDTKTAEMIQNLSWSFELQYFAIPKSHQGVARNRAAEKAQGKHCLLIGDDIFLAPDTCEKHLKMHEKFQSSNPKSQTTFNSAVAVLGFTTWDPSLHITPLMRWMESSGVQFGYPQITQNAHEFLPPKKQHWFTYTSHLSLPTWLLRHHPFREDVSLYGWEDIEWGRRIADAGVKLFYEPDAKAYHHHALADAEVWERSRILGLAAVEMEQLVPGLQLTPRGWRKFVYQWLSILPTYRGRHCRAFLQGMCQGAVRQSPSAKSLLSPLHHADRDD